MTALEGETTGIEGIGQGMTETEVMDETDGPTTDGIIEIGTETGIDEIATVTQTDGEMIGIGIGIETASVGLVKIGKRRSQQQQQHLWHLVLVNP